MEIIIFEKSRSSFKKPKHLKNNVSIVYCPRAVKIEPATSMKIDTEMAVFLPKNSKRFVISIFRRDKINEIHGEKQRLWIEILNKSFEDTIEIKKNHPLGFFVIGPEDLKFKYETSNMTPQKNISTYKPKTKETT